MPRFAVAMLLAPVLPGGAKESAKSPHGRNAEKSPPGNPVENRSNLLEGNGAQGRNRTSDTAIFSRMLYQLSYLGPLVAAPWRGDR